MAEIQVTRDLLVEDAVFILQCLRQNQRGGRLNGLVEVQQTLANSVTLDLGDYVAFLRRFGYVDVDARAAALQLTPQGDHAAVDESRSEVAEKVDEHFAPLLARGSVELDDVESGAALESLLASAGIQPPARPSGVFADITSPSAPAPAAPPPPPAEAAAPAELVVRAARLEPAEGELGQGALGRVRAARWGELGRTVAIKQWKPLLQYLPWLSPAELGQRVLVEARAQAQLNHPCVVPVIDVQTRPNADGPLLVMPLAAGGSLRGKLAQKLSLAQVFRFGAQVATALAHAHAAGMSHTALKAENVLLDGRGNAQVADFGTGRLVAPSRPAPGERAPRVSVDLGEGAYRAPEVSAGSAADATADAWSFGVLLYEMLTGHVPGRRSPMPSAVRQDVSQEIDDLVDALLDDDPSHRPSMGTAAAKLALALGTNPLYLL